MAGVTKPKVRKCQQRCSRLDPVQEDCVANVDVVPTTQSSKPYCGVGKERFQGPTGNWLSKLRDGYEKLMNNMASHVDLTGVSALYGCPTWHVDFPDAAGMAAMRASKQDQDVVQAAFLAGASQTQKKL